MFCLSNDDSSLPSVNALLQLLAVVLDVHVLDDIRSLIICHLATQVFVQSLGLQTLLQTVERMQCKRISLMRRR